MKKLPPSTEGSFFVFEIKIQNYSIASGSGTNTTARPA
jgi:hypothetical protein